MDKNAIQKYAVWARNELIEQIKQRAYQYGISDKGYGDENAAVIAGRVLAPEEKRQRHEFVVQIKAHGFGQAVEEVAYTWFNRFVALRYMEVNDYLPTHVRVFSDVSGAFNPEILKDILHLELPGLDKEKVSDLLNANKTEELYRYLLLTQCNALNEALPEMFEKLGSYTEMLLPNNILKPDSVLGRLVTDIPEEDWKDAVQIIGWMYQYYNTEPKQAVFDGLKKNIKITKEKIPAATQLFTPDWIVRYMVENSLGRLWLESHPNDALKANWKYYLDEAEQTPEVTEQLRVLRAQSPVKSPEDIRLIDPCMGSGHILVYAFDVLMQIYESEGYNPRDAAKLILEKNIYGLDIDPRAYQLAYFALLMKARQYNRRAFDPTSPRPQVYHPAGWSDGEEFGSLVKVDVLPPKPELPKDQLTIFDDYERDLRVWNFKRLLAQKYDVVVTNPPYMGAGGMSAKMTDFVKNYYPDSKSDASTAFMEQTINMCNATGYMTMINIPVWMFIASYEKLRGKIIRNNTIVNMVHFGRGVFGSDFGTTSFVIANQDIKGFKGIYHRLFEKQGAVDSVEQKRDWFFEGKGRFIACQDDYLRIPATPIAYWVSQRFISNFEQTSLSKSHYSGGRNKTHNNELYLRYWWEISNRLKWQPYVKGGDFRRWYGNQESVVDWSESARAEYDSHGGLYNQKFAGKTGICWTLITSAKTAFRIKNPDEHYDSGAPTIFNKAFTCDFKVLAFLNSCVAVDYLSLLNPTINMGNTYVLSLPMLDCAGKEERIVETTKHNISLSRSDWDSFETSWDFKRHPLICGERTVAVAFSKWEREATERFNTLKANEEELNRIFIDIYGLQDELTPEVEDKDVTVRRADLGREIRSLISYAVGCMFGRYSLDIEGLAFTGGEWDSGKYKTFVPDKDNILPICDDEYFDDDIMGRFVEFVRVVYGTETLDENLKFIADAYNAPTCQDNFLAFLS